MTLIPANAIQTQYGVFDFVNLDANVIDARDIAHALSKLCRFNGHTSVFYSVAQHCCFIHDRMKAEGHDDNTCLAGLLHDAHEAYVSDVARPLKAYLRQYHNFDFNEYADRLDTYIFKAFGVKLTPDVKAVVKDYDNKALFTEKQFVLTKDHDWGYTLPSWTKAEFAPYRGRLNWKREFLIRLKSYGT
jgi:5'-deoxynucleotidase YfbR-like HD superfamily hydrolase